MDMDMGSRGVAWGHVWSRGVTRGRAGSRGVTWGHVRVTSHKTPMAVMTAGSRPEAAPVMLIALLAAAASRLTADTSLTAERSTSTCTWPEGHVVRESRGQRTAWSGGGQVVCHVVGSRGQRVTW